MDWIEVVGGKIIYFIFSAIILLSSLSLLVFVVFEIKKSRILRRKRPRREDVVKRWRRIRKYKKNAMRARRN